MALCSGDFSRLDEVDPLSFGQDDSWTYPEVSGRDSRVKLTPLDEILKTISLEEFLMRDKANAKEQEKNLLWFHGKITRETAVHILQENGNTEGLFLVRESTTAPGDFVVSLVHDSQPQHFQIHCLGDFYYQVDNGPLYHGLDALVNFYMEGANGLSTRLYEFCKGEVPPATARRRGRTTPLHRAVLDGNLSLVQKILQSPYCSPLDARNTAGQTVLHDASFMGDAQIVEKLLEGGANVNCKDSNCVTPLHTACIHAVPHICKLLLQRGADPTLRHPMTGWVPLHEAAMHGHTKCVHELLRFGAPCHPRSVDNDTPLDLARRYNHPETIRLFKNYQPATPKTMKVHWDHGTLDRNTAMEIIQNYGARDGQFLIRSSLNKEGIFVLSMAANGSIYNFEINKKGDQLFIDDGPYFETLEHLVNHYMHYDDGLPMRLLHPISQHGTPPNQHATENQHRNLPNVPVRNGDRPPTLGPRPTDLTRDSPLPGSASPSSPSRAMKKGPFSQDHLDHHASTSKPASGFSRLFSRTRKREQQKLLQQQQQEQLKAASGEKDMVNINVKEIQKGKEIGQGEYGSVLQGKWRNHDVALKTLHQDHLQTGQREFLREARVMHGLNHACIVRLHGVVMGPPMMLVQELVSMGALLDLLIDHPDQISEENLRLWAAQIACGMMYLETKKFVHRDLAARNILLVNKEQVKISDFGLSRATGENNDYYRATTGGRWPVKWYAPESIYFGTFSHASDVWSYGVTVWEMYTYGDQPYGDMMGAEVIQMIERGARLTMPDGCSRKVYNIMMECWSYDAYKRPTFNDLNKMFSEDPDYREFYHAGVKQAPSKKR
ncbi:tyrosine-protein kinase HTK16-like isoform X1 [Asterias rubens]|uniref:tyrosine-protein kinase HTK16-like isoform X1 n=1 Tax=Asterias rubens TaxID=7604 RepID=UPI00145564D6|nr:tyrosine-protein kinase HTK16-like isoform X1 [Asterias rubens]XP_033637568.1 tyrosine-protein kinase HTK16-like isoform X1 [Asterias rubens]